MPNVIVTAYIPVEHLEAINDAVKNGKFKNKSELIRMAVEKFLEEIK